MISLIRDAGRQERGERMSLRATDITEKSLTTDVQCQDRREICAM